MDNFQIFSDLIDKHLFFLPAGINEGYDNKFSRYAQLYVILNKFRVYFFLKKIHENDETLSKIIEYKTLLLNDGKLENLSIEKEIIEFLLSLDKI